MKNIKERLIFNDIIKYLEIDDIIVLHGARQVGKTHILFYLRDYLKKQKRPVLYIDLEDQRNLDVINNGIEEFLRLVKQSLSIKDNIKSQKYYILIDEIQYLNNPSSFLKLIADHHKYLKLIVSGSSSFEIKSKFKDSLVGRTLNFEIYPLTFFEFLQFKNKEYDFEYLKKNRSIGVIKEELKSLYKEFILYGGYPKIVLTDNVVLKEKYLLQITDTYLRKDIRDLAHIRELDKFNKLLEVLASQSGQLLNITELANTCRLNRETVKSFLFILENTYIIKLIRPFSNNLRSELFKTPKIFFYDSGLMQILWLKKLQTEIIGNVFETNVFGELVKKYGSNSIRFWRTMDKKEIDFILEQNNTFLPIEVKINALKFNKTAIDYFLKKYKKNKYRLIALNDNSSEADFYYPWQI